MEKVTGSQISVIYIDFGNVRSDTVIYSHYGNITDNTEFKKELLGKKLLITKTVQNRGFYVSLINSKIIYLLPCSHFQLK